MPSVAIIDGGKLNYGIYPDKKKPDHNRKGFGHHSSVAAPTLVSTSCNTLASARALW